MRDGEAGADLADVSAELVRRAARQADVAGLVRRRGELVATAGTAGLGAGQVRDAWRKGEQACHLLRLEAARIRAAMRRHHRQAILLRALQPPGGGGLAVDG